MDGDAQQDVVYFMCYMNNYSRSSVLLPFN